MFLPYHRHFEVRTLPALLDILPSYLILSIHMLLYKILFFGNIHYYLRHLSFHMLLDLDMGIVYLPLNIVET